MPDSALGLTLKNIGEGRVHSLPLRETSFLTDRGTHQRMPEPELSAVDLYQAGADRRLQQTDRHLYAHHQRGGVQHLTQPRAIIQRGHQQGGACVSGQVERPGSEGPL